MTPKQLVDAKTKLGAEDALRLAHKADTVIIAKGKKIVTFSMRKDCPDDAVLLAHMLGPTGNLRAPAMRKGKKLLIGFNEDAYAAAL